MSRLIEGDVGSGKTFVAATVAYATIKNRPAGQSFGNLQVGYMAPTEVLATQLFENFVEYFKHTGISIGLITGSGCRKFPTKIASAQKPWTEISRTQLLKWVKNGEIPILIGTHALIQKSVDFEDLGLVIIDEQHRFGTNQRMKLAKKEGHALSLSLYDRNTYPKNVGTYLVRGIGPSPSLTKCQVVVNQ
jgi:ATP-dependent DNA helicase RecG